MIKSINFVELGNTLCEYDYVEVAKMMYMQDKAIKYT